MFLKFLVTPLCTSTAKKSSRLQNRNSSNEFFPPPPTEFLQPIIRATGPGLKDGFIDDYCSFKKFFFFIQ
jgi:hypothetical protein